MELCVGTMGREETGKQEKKSSPFVFLLWLFNILTNQAPAVNPRFYFYYILKVVLKHIITHK